MQIELVLIIAFLLAVIFWLYNKQNKEKILLNDLQSQMKKLENELLDTADNIVSQIQEVSMDLEERLEDAHDTLAALKEEIGVAEKKKFALDKIDIKGIALNFAEAKETLEDLKVQIEDISKCKAELKQEKNILLVEECQDFEPLSTGKDLLVLESKSPTPVEEKLIFDFPTLLGQSETELLVVEDKQFYDDESSPKHERIISLLEQGYPDEEVARLLGIGTNEVFLTKKLNRR